MREIMKVIGSLPQMPNNNLNLLRMIERNLFLQNVEVLVRLYLRLSNRRNDPDLGDVHMGVFKIYTSIEMFFLFTTL